MNHPLQPNTCPQCRAVLPADAPQGLCPACLLAAVAEPTEAGTAPLPKAPPPTREQVAAAFPQLEILELIGAGGMGYVFKARQPKLDRLVALKLLPQSLAADPAFAGRFEREGRILARLSHSNIVTVHDFGFAPVPRAGDLQSPPLSNLNPQLSTSQTGFYYLLMEFVDGVNLRQAMRAGRFTPVQALEVVPKICEALQFAHEQGILHRDIKPENILLDARGRVKLVDFGIAKLVDDGRAELPLGLDAEAAQQRGPATLTSATAALGTPSYMAPEQRDRPADVDHRADIYSLGVVFYEMLTGELPVGKFAPPSAKSASDPRVDQVVLRALEQQRERRQQSAGEVKTQVETIASTPGSSRREEAQPPPPIPLPQLGFFRRSLGWGVFLGALATLGFIVAFALLIGGSLLSQSLQTRPVTTGATLAGIFGLVVWFSWRRAGRCAPTPPEANGGSGSGLPAVLMFVMGATLFLLYVHPGLFGRTRSSLEAQISPLAFQVLGWVGIALLAAGVGRLAWRSSLQAKVPRTLAMTSVGLLGLAALAYFRSTSSRQTEFHWHIWLVVALGIVAGWQSLAAMRGQTVGFGWRGLAVFGALTACALPLWMAFILGTGKLLRPFPTLWHWVVGEQMEGLGLRYLSLAVMVATLGCIGWRAWRWSQSKAELPGERLAVGFAVLFLVWACSTREMERNAYYPTPAYDSVLLPETVRIFQTQQTVMGTQGASFSGRWEGQRPGWQLDAGWVALDGSGAGPAQRTSLTSNHFHFMFRWPASFVTSQPSPVRAPRPAMLPPVQWLLLPGERQTILTRTNAAGDRLAGFVELLPETPPNPLGNAALALHRIISRLPDGQPVPGRVGLSLTLAPRQVAAVQVFVRERDTLTPLPKLSALLVAPAGERIERQIHWQTFVTGPTTDGQVPRVWVETGVAGHLSRLIEAQVPELLAGFRLLPTPPRQPVMLAPGELREWVLFECPPDPSRRTYRQREIVVRITAQPLAADWQPDLVQPHFRLGTNWVRLTQPDPVRASQRVRPPVSSMAPPAPRPPRNEISLAWTNVSVHPSGEVVAQGSLALSGGEKLLGRVRLADGATEPAYAWSSVHTLPFGVAQTAGVNWKFPASFTDTDKAEAASRTRLAMTPPASLTLLADQWQPLFIVTNGTGEVVTGEAMFSPASPREGPPEVVLHLLSPPFQIRNSPQLDLHFRSEAPVGYRLVTHLQRPPNSPGMTASTRTTFSGARASEHAQWFLQGVLKPDMDKARAQVAAFLEQTPLRLRPGERREVFTFTTDRGETYTGAVELQPIP